MTVGRRPNKRVQRTRSSPSALRSPLTRHPLGGMHGLNTNWRSACGLSSSIAWRSRCRFRLPASVRSFMRSMRRSPPSHPETLFSQLPSGRAVYASFDDGGPHDAGRFGLHEFCHLAPSKQIVGARHGGLVGKVLVLDKPQWTSVWSFALSICRGPHLRTARRDSGQTSALGSGFCSVDDRGSHNGRRFGVHGSGRYGASRQIVHAVVGGLVGEGLRSWQTALPNQSLERTRGSVVGVRLMPSLACAGARAAQLCVIAPSKAWRILPGESPGRERANHPPVSSVALAAESGGTRLANKAGEAYTENPVGRRGNRVP